MHRRTVLVVVGWFVAAAAATGAGLAAVRVIGDGITAGPGAEVVDADRVARDLAAATPTGPTPTATAPTTPTATAAPTPSAVGRRAVAATPAVR
ncbi:hypothetical protein [Micromonospora zhanjiangensis]